MSTPMPPINPPPAPEGSASGKTGQLAFELGHTPSVAEADFTVGESNEMAFGHILAFPNWLSPLSLIVGPPKSGKSHLARIWAERAGARILHAGEAAGLARAGGEAPLVIEDVDRPGYDEASLFHLLNQSMRQSRPVLMTARAPIAAWPYLTDDLRSRARLATHLEVRPPEDSQLSQMFVKLFGDRQVAVDPRTIGYIVARMERSPAEVVALADLMDRLALARGTAIGRAVAAEALARRAALRGAEPRGIDLEDERDE